MSGPRIRFVSEGEHILEMEERDYDMTDKGGGKGVSRKIKFPVLGGMHEVHFTTDQFNKFKHFNGQAVKLIGTVEAKPKGGVALHLDNIEPAKEAPQRNAA